MSLKIIEMANQIEGGGALLITCIFLMLKKCEEDCNWLNIYYLTTVYSRAVQKLIAINRIQNKSLCLHNIFNYFV